MIVDNVFIHHEGGGSPRDGFRPLATKGGDDPYTIVIGSTSYRIAHDPSKDTATKGFNHRSIGICLTGNRDVHPVTDGDLELVRAAVADCRKRGWVTGAPLVRPHRAVRLTDCPGKLTMLAWPQVLAAVLAGAQQTQIVPVEEEDVAKPVRVYPEAKLDDGTQPTCISIEGDFRATILHPEQDQRYAYIGVPRKPVAVDVWKLYTVDGPFD